MNKSLYKQLCMNYGKEPDKDLYELWEYNLRCYDEEEIQKAINIIIAKDKYFPNLSRIFEVVKEVVSKENCEVSDYEKIDKMKKLNIIPNWLGKEIVNEEIDKETQKEFEDFNNFIQEFRNER